MKNKAKISRIVGFTGMIVGLIMMYNTTANDIIFITGMIISLISMPIAAIGLIIRDIQRYSNSNDHSDHNPIQSEIFSDWLQEGIAQKLANGTHIIHFEIINSINTQSIDAVLYNISNIIDRVKTLNEFKAYISEKNYNIKDFEVDRCTIYKE